MTFLAILLALLIERGYPDIAGWRQVELFHDYVAWFRSRFTRPWLLGRWGLAGLLLPPLLAVWLLREWLEPIGLLIDLAVLVLCLGPRDLFEDLRTLRRNAGDDASLSFEGLSGFSLDADRARGETLTETLVGAALNRLYSTVFWFVLLGPVGALLYRAAAELEDRREDMETEFEEAVWQLYCLLEWLPARLLAGTAAIVGHYDGALSAWRDAAEVEVFDDSRRLAGAVVHGAMDMDAVEDRPGPAVDRLRDFIMRAGIVWLTLLALLTLAGATD